jgi:GNAT superfamily N-acetyltransferase
MISIEDTRGTYRISTKKSDLDIQLIQKWLNEDTYWATTRNLEIIKTSIENSLCIGLYDSERQIGFARIVTDYATFAWLCDVFIAPEYRGKGLGKWLIETIVNQPILSKLLILLGTRDAQGLYKQYGGFTSIEGNNWMLRRKEI